MMKKYEIGLYEKAMRNTLSWSEKLRCAKDVDMITWKCA